MMIVGAAACSLGCSATFRPSPATTSELPQAITAESPVADAAVARTVDRRLDEDAMLSGRGIGVGARQGIVTLRGEVDCVLARRRAVQLAQVVRGVRAVIDHVDVVSSPRPDDELATAAASALAQDPALAAGERIAAVVRDGRVQLTGDVDSEGARVIAERDVLVIPGVRQVSDDLAVWPRARDDVSLAAAARRLLDADPWLDGARLRVDVHRGVVRIAGHVGSPQEWSRAQTDAASSSASVVDMALVIDPWQDDGTVRGLPVLPVAAGDVDRTMRDVYAVDPRARSLVRTEPGSPGAIVLSDDQEGGARTGDSPQRLGLTERQPP
jgi:osmotically-inducible protein OsmY